MSLEESFSQFYKGCTEFSAAENKCRAAPPSSVQLRFHTPPAIITAPRDAPFNSLLYQCEFCSFTTHAYQKS